MKRVLAGFIMDGHSGGTDKYLLNFLENVKGEEVRIDFLTNEVDPELEQYLKERHSRIFAISNLKHPIRQYWQVCRILDKGKYDIVYLNLSTAIDCIAAWAAKRKQIKRILIHSHSSGNDCEGAIKRGVFDSIHYICRLFLYKTATEYYGCSKKAGVWLFPKWIVKSAGFHTIFNAVDTGRFVYRGEIRKEVRQQLGLEDAFVVGHVGNYTYQKNHYFVIDIFEELHKRYPGAVLLLAGTGERFETVKSMVEQKGLTNCVKMLGQRADVDCLMQAMDVFLLPSNFEGMPTVGVEAQCAGLPCLMSGTITKEAKITDKCRFLSLKVKPQVWAEALLAYKENNREEIAFLDSKESYSLETLKKQQKKLISKA